MKKDGKRKSFVEGADVLPSLLPQDVMRFACKLQVVDKALRGGGSSERARPNAQRITSDHSSIDHWSHDTQPSLGVVVEWDASNR